MTEFSPSQQSPSQLFELYKDRMDAALQTKLEHLIPNFPEYVSQKESIIVSIGAGTGLVEDAIQKIFPSTKVIALDKSLPMIEEIKNQNGKSIETLLQSAEISPLPASAENIPLASNSADVIIASSSLHEVISFGDDQKIGPHIIQFFKEAHRVLKPGGRLIIRDFMQPENPTEEIILQIGEAQEESDAIPHQFILDFIRKFKGDDLSYLENQISKLPNKTLESGSKLKIRADHALEIAIHYSWADRFEDEVKEKYAYLPIDQYAKLVVDSMQESDTSAFVVSTNSHLQPGYPKHIGGRLNLFKKDGSTYPLPPFTGVIVVEKDKNHQQHPTNL